MLSWKKYFLLKLSKKNLIFTVQDSFITFCIIKFLFLLNNLTKLLDIYRVTTLEPTFKCFTLYTCFNKYLLKHVYNVKHLNVGSSVVTRYISNNLVKLFMNSFIDEFMDKPINEVNNLNFKLLTSFIGLSMNSSIKEFINNSKTINVIIIY